MRLRWIFCGVNKRTVNVQASLSHTARIYLGGCEMNIPLYVYILFFALLYMGIKRCFSRVIKVQRLMIAPLFFTFLSVRGMLTLFNIYTADVMLWMLGSLVGVLIGYLHVRNRRLKADHARQLLQVPGGWSMLGLIIAAAPK